MNSIIAAVVWLVITGIFIAIEFGAKKYFLPFAMGAGVAAVSAIFGLSIIGQIAVFAVVTILAYVLFRPEKKEKGSKGAAKRNTSEDDEIFFD
ncbi:MAG: NfeD family protein [Coriobacteriales bacterium]|jgi:membrane protein implicated in regulation of membrane protease activity